MTLSSGAGAGAEPKIVPIDGVYGIMQDGDEWRERFGTRQQAADYLAELAEQDREPLDQTSEELIEEIRRQVGAALGLETVDAYAYNTGGGCMVLEIDLSQDGRGMGRRAWLTRDENLTRREALEPSDSGWLLGLYDAAISEEDEGIAVTLHTGSRDNDPAAVAAQVAGLFKRLGVKLA